MTGLDPYADKIIEIATIITDGDLNIIAKGEDLVITQSQDVMDNMNQWCIDQHAKTGLTASVLASKLTTRQVEIKVLGFIKMHVSSPNTAMLAGSSVHMDKEFLRREMPELLAYLHYRLIDVSCVKELARSWYPKEFAKAPEKLYTHRALDDILESIKELEFYKTSIFK